MRLSSAPECPHTILHHLYRRCMTKAMTTAPGYDSTRVSANCLTYVRTLPSDCTVNTIYIGARLSIRHAVPAKREVLHVFSPKPAC